MIRGAAIPRTGSVVHEECARIAALAPSAALGALETADAAEVREHVTRCSRSHAELRDAIALAALVGRAVPDVAMPSPALRERLLAAARVSPSGSPS